MSDKKIFKATDFLAHIRSEDNFLIAHHLEEHLTAVSRLAADFAAEFGAAPWAALAGLWHDLGKYREGFQRYIRQSGDPDAHIEGRVAGLEKTHSAAGALWAQEYLSEVDKQSGPCVARVLSYLIAGHHPGLDNWADGLCVRFGLEDTKKEGRTTQVAAIPQTILKPEAGWPGWETIPTDQAGDIPGRFALWVRMLFSCLVDADFLDTEAFMSQEKTEGRTGFMPLAAMESQLTTHLAKMAQDVATRGEAASPVNRKRAEVLQSCREKAACPPGVFSLTVPTGGGKTLSSLAFALRHAQRHGKHRVIYAIPYTSIIEQTAKTFRDIFGEENVVEHHSNIEVDERQETHRSRLACENWDAPLIVTTNVQLLESLFASRTSRCRKLHNLVGSVIVLDEAQLLPVNFLQPVLDVLRLLVKEYGVTLVLCTATQPDLRQSFSVDAKRARRGFQEGEITEIIADVAGLYRHLQRVRTHRPIDLLTPVTWEALASELASHEAVLTIVSRRADAQTLYRQLKAQTGEAVWHLSGLMCAEHRSHVIEKIKAALLARRVAIAEGRPALPVRVVSTNLVEAGVDIDFPVVYRALAGLDSLAQAAGRCNREGRLEVGEFHVFVPPSQAPAGLLRMARQSTEGVWANLPEAADPLGLELFRDYFRRLYQDANLDEKEIVKALRMGSELEIRFRDAAEAFRLIDDKNSATVFVRYRCKEDDKTIDILLALLQNREKPLRWVLRKLQRYGVSIYEHDLHALEQRGDVEPLGLISLRFINSQ